MTFQPITDYALFHSLLTVYYREGEDVDTPQEQLDGFVGYLYDLLKKKTISGAFAWDEKPVGFVLWALDSEELPFSNKPGCGTILEIGVVSGCRGKGYGKALAEFAESSMEDTAKYVCAYGPAEAFWEKCGYRESGETAQNGLKIFVKG